MQNRKSLVLIIAAFVIVIGGASILYSKFSKSVGQNENIAEQKNEKDSSKESVKAPNFTVLNQKESEVHFDDFKGKPVIINFWASWCGPCQSEMPDFQEVYEKYGDVSRGDLCDISLQIQETNEQPERLPDEETERLMYADTLQYMCENGYHRYEISNYARNDVHNRNRYECRHNRVYWERGDYLGFGIGAASLMDNVRWSNCRDIERYVMETGNPDKIREQREKLSIHAQMEEFMFLGLRLTEGIRISEFETYFGVPIAEIYGNRIRKFQQEKLLEQKGDFIRLTAKGTDLSNYVMAEFLFDHADQKNE